MNKRILVIDDDDSILDAISLVLQDDGFQVDTSNKGEEIYSKIESFNPDAILLDVLMSGKDGRDICRILKSTDKVNKIPVIMISAHPSAKSGAISCGADDFLAKPFETKDLLDTIKKHLK